MAQTIPCRLGCPPPSTGIGRAAKTLKWKFIAGNGAITSVTGLPSDRFTNGRRDGDDYKIDYQGGPPSQKWIYRLSSSPACPSKAEQAQLTSGLG